MEEKFDYRPISFWSLNDELRDDKIVHQINEMFKQGYGGFFLHARAGLLTEYLSDEWFERLETAVNTAAKLGMKAWLYDENGWPSGFAGGLVPDLGESYTAHSICFAKKMPENGGILAVYKEKDGEYKRIEHDDIKNGDLFCYKEPLLGYADILNPLAVDAFIRFTHEKYKEKLGKYFGSVIPGIFTDEPQLTGKYAYTDSLADEFRKEYGIDFFDNAWLLYIESEKSYSFRHDTAKLISKMLFNNFTRKINDWCQKNRLILTGHFPCEDGLCAQNKTTFGVMKQYEGMGRPGTDFLGRRLISPVALKQVADAAAFAGEKIVTSESFGCCGWDVSFPELMWIVAYQAIFGVNSIVTHLSAYSIKGRRKRDYPAFYSEQEPWWDRFSVLTSGITGVNEYISKGERRPRIAVIHPMSSMWCVSGGQTELTAEARYISNQFRLLIENLNDLQKDYLLITEENLSQLKTEGSKLTGRGFEFDTVIVPDSFSLEKETVDVLEKYSLNNGKVVFINRFPCRCCGVLTERIAGIKADDVQNRRELIYKWFAANGMDNEVEIIDPYSKRTLSGVLTSIKYPDGLKNIMIFNPDRNTVKKGLLKSLGECSFISEKGLPLKSFFDGKYTFAEILLYPSSYINISIESVSQTGYDELLLDQTKLLKDFTVSKDECNSLTIDKCDIYVNDKPAFLNVNPIEKCDELYKLAYESGKETAIKIVYTFFCEFKGKIPDWLRIAVETSNDFVLLNGKKIFADGEFYIEDCIKTFNANGCIKNGKNTIETEFLIIRPDEMKDELDFEGYRNIFFYENEPESSYVLGNFSVMSKDKPLCDGESLVTDGDFVISDYADLTFAELTSQGNWFYRGNYLLETEIALSRGEYSLCFTNFEFTLADVYINNVLAGAIFKEPFELDIKNYIKEGNNTIKIILYGSNRNALGPHHHKMKNPHFVGDGTFKGEFCFCDFIYPCITGGSTKTDSYTFVKKDPRGIMIKKYVRNSEY